MMNIESGEPLDFGNPKCASTIYETWNSPWGGISVRKCDSISDTILAHLVVDTDRRADPNQSFRLTFQVSTKWSKCVRMQIFTIVKITSTKHSTPGVCFG